MTLWSISLSSEWGSGRGGGVGGARMNGHLSREKNPCSNWRV